MYAPSQAKWRVLGDFFEARLKDPRFLQELRTWGKAVGKGRRGKTLRLKGKAGKRRGKGTGETRRNGQGKKGGVFHTPPRPRVLPNATINGTMDFDPVYSEEVAKAVWSLASSKVPGPYGYPVDIFK